MTNALRTLTVLFLIGCMIPGAQAVAQGSTTLSGIVKDSQSGEPLPGANVVLVGTGLGSATDLAGRYTIRGVVPGEYQLKVSYVGYQTLDTKISVSASSGAMVTKDYKLLPVGVEGETIVVTAQASGQNAAINQQLSSMSVMNVVSGAKIQELPDVNAAESVSRLPGVALIRTGGEGSQVIIRGLSPQYNQVTIDGVELPSDIPSSSNNVTDAALGVGQGMGDRAEDLSMVSSSMLGGIEVIKAITPDMDATLIGGVVNFSMRKAAKGTLMTQRNQTLIPMFELRAEGGYNDLKNSKNDFRLAGSVENRFLDESFGVFLQGTIERRNLSDNSMGAVFGLVNKDNGAEGNPVVTSINENDGLRIRNRKGLTLVMDYQYDGGEIGFMNFYSNSGTKTIDRGINLADVKTGSVNFTAGEEDNTQNVFSNLISIKQDLPIFHLEGKFSHSFSESFNPEDLTFNFRQDFALTSPTNYLQAHPSITMDALVLRDSAAILNDMSTSRTHSTERAYSGSLDLMTSIPIADGITSKLKFGGMIQTRKRYYDFNYASGNMYYSGGSGVTSAMIRAYPWLASRNGTVTAQQFMDTGYDVGKFLRGDYPSPYPVNVNQMWMLLPIAKATATLEGYQKRAFPSLVNNYDGNETKSAGYVMATFNIGDQISIVPGARYQNLTTTYTGYRGLQTSNSLQGKDTTVTVSHGYWLPMLHLRYEATDWLQFHFAYTNTLTYPDYSILTPRYIVYVGGTINYNNYTIKPGRSENLDLVMALHSNELGLVSLNGFKKRITDLVFRSSKYVTDLSDYPELKQYSGTLFNLVTYVNNPIAVDLYGIEAEWQTHFWYLPGMLSGIIFNINYTHIFSEASYPITNISTIYNDDGTFTQTITDTSYKARMLNQPNDVVNVTLGYDFEGFSARVSMLYQDNIFRNPDFWPQLWAISAKHTRWDVSVKQELPWYGLQIFANVNNLTGEDDVTLNNKNNFPVAQERYAMTASVGLRIRL